MSPRIHLNCLIPQGRNIRICSTKLMTITSGEINLQSKRDIICHFSALSGVIPFFILRNIPIESNASIKQEKCILQWDSKDKIIT